LRTSASKKLNRKKLEIVDIKRLLLKKQKDLCSICRQKLDLKDKTEFHHDPSVIFFFKLFTKILTINKLEDVFSFEPNDLKIKFRIDQ
jgi:hypothetical protein